MSSKDETQKFSASERPALEDSIKVAQEALDLFLNNQFEDAKKILKSFSSSDIYHSLGFATVNYLQAAITMESDQIRESSNAVKICLTICQKSRRKSRMSNTLKVSSKSAQLHEFAKYTDEQCHAELCYAECLLQKAFLTFVQDENLIALIKGGLKIRECYRTYKDCWNILKVKQWDNTFVKTSFESGVRLGVGAFNLMISMLPPRILKLLEFIGFKGNKDFGLDEMNKAANLENSLRQPLASLMLLAYHTFIGVITGIPPYNEHIIEAKRLIEPCLVKYEKSAIFGLFVGRIDLICGRFDEAIAGYEASISYQNEWKNLHDICYWELLWCYALQGDWLLAMKYAEKLSQHSRWSKAIYLYQKAVFLIECYSESQETVSDEMRQHIKKIFDSVPKMMQRFAGKSLPVEKFAAKKSKRYADQNDYLLLPGVELIFIWNGFKIMGKNQSAIAKFYELCDKNLQQLTASDKKKTAFYYDNVALATMLKAVCFEYMNRFPEAISLFNEVIGPLAKHLKEDLYLPPYAEVELAQIAFAENRYEDVRQHIRNAKAYHGYSLESRLHFRIQGINYALKKVSPDKESVSGNSWDHSSIVIDTTTSANDEDNIDEFFDCDSEDVFNKPSSLHTEELS